MLVQRFLVPVVGVCHWGELVAPYSRSHAVKSVNTDLVPPTRYPPLVNENAFESWQAGSRKISSNDSFAKEGLFLLQTVGS